jgi:tRNA modification GTPase
VGRPNAGKSSVLNALARHDAAIVTPVPGTTRDIVEVALDVEGYRVALADTAGLRDAVDEIEAEGVRRGKAWAQAAALRLFVVDASALADVGGPELEVLVRPGDVLVLNKMDRASDAMAARCKAYGAAQALTVVEAAAGLNSVGEIEAVLRRRVVEGLAGSEAPAVTRARHREALAAALSQLDRALAPGRPAELVAEDVRLVSRALERLSGRVGAEDVLDRVFSSFCIGK